MPDDTLERQASLEAERAFLLRSLDDLDAERDAGDIDDGTFARLHADYTARAAAVLRALRGGDAPRPATPVPASRRWLAAGVLVVVAATAAWVLSQALGERRPGRTATGNDAITTPTGEPGADLRAAVDAAPDDYGTRIAYARFLLSNDLADALRQYDAAAALDPRQPEALAYGGWIRALVAQRVEDDADRARLVEQALARLDRAITADAEYEDAYVFKGLVLLNLSDDPAAAIPMLQRFLALAPEDHPQRPEVLDALARAVDESQSSP